MPHTTGAGAPSTTEGTPFLAPPLVAPRRTIGRRRFDFERQVAVMAIVNRTPDSFYDRGRTFALDAAVDAAVAAADEGADWVDIGGVPFSPDTPPVSAADELDRVLPVVAALREASDVVISVDTARAEVARHCVAAGADVINDTSGLADPAMAHVVAESGATLVLCHSLVGPRVPHPAPAYADVVAEVVDFLRRRVDRALERGVRPEQLVVDPGHDLNKNTDHSLELVRRLGAVTALGHPTLVALSRKDFVGETLGRQRQDRLAGSLAAATLCLAAGARVVRAHDVAATVDVVRMVEAVLGWRSPVESRHNR